VALLVTMALVVVGCAPSVANGAGATTGATGVTATPGASSATASPSGIGALGAAPQSCPSGSKTTLIASSLGSGLGSSPVWGTGPDVSGPQATIHLGATATHTAIGWQGTVVWVVKAHAEGPVVLQGMLLTGDQPPIWYQAAPQQATTEIVLDLAHPGSGSTSAFARYPTSVFVPQAGCYQMSANWYTGSWSAVVSIGR